MKIVLTSAMRNTLQLVPRYFRQVAGLYLAAAERGTSIYVLIGEGDSTDATRYALEESMRTLGLPGALIDTTHGGPSFGSIINAKRFAQLASVYNTLWRCIPDDADAVVFVEGDLIWKPEMMLALVDRLDMHSAVAPMVFHLPDYAGYGGVRAFYDTWGFAIGGQHFGNLPPYHVAVNSHPVRLDHAGSCIAMRAEAARRVYFPAEDMVVGMTRMLADNGDPVWLQPDLYLEHPNV